MASLRLQGIIPPLVTPFDTEGALDLPAFEANIDRYAEVDLGGYLVLGSNGEAASVDEAEKLTLVRSARRRAGSRTLIVGTGLESTRATIDLTNKVADLGADGVLVLTPHYYRPFMTEQALRRHYETVAENARVPVFLYSMPAFTGLPLPVALPAALSGHPNIAGLKDSSGDIALLGRVLANVPAGFSVACGSAPVLYPALCVGAHAGILAVACCAPAPAVALFRAVSAGDHARARRIQEAVTPLAVAVTATHGVAGLKAAMMLEGFRGGSVRSPLLDVEPSVHAELEPLLATAREAA
jgi:4-hydroxy-2-oxoglutarate aldolase